MKQWDGYVHLFLAALGGMAVNFLVLGQARGEYALGVFILYPLGLLGVSRGGAKKKFR